MVSFATILSSGSIWQLGLTTRPGRRRISGSARSWFQAASGHELAQTIDKDSKLLQFRITVARGLAAATFCWAVQGPDPPIEYRGLFAGPSATRRFAAKTLDGSRSGNRTNRPPIRSRSGHRRSAMPSDDDFFNSCQV